MDDKAVVFDILTRLPVKSLMRFMCISKSWCHLISKDSCFIRHHLQFQKASKDSGALLLLPYAEPSRNKDVTVDYLSLGTSHLTKIRPPWKKPQIMPYKRDPYRDFYIVGHCNGGVCISDAHRVILWNPMIQRFKILPETVDYNRQLETEYRVGRPIYVKPVLGFGFVPSSYDAAGHGYCYKVVRITYTSGAAGILQHDRPALGEIYDSRSKSWTRIADQDVERLSIDESSDNSVLIDGSLYWLGMRKKTREEEDASVTCRPHPKITALNLAEKRFRNIELPDEFDWRTGFGKKIAALGESELALFSGDQRHLLLLSVWGTKVDHLSWTKLFRINLDAQPLGFSGNGEVLLQMRFSWLALLDPELRDPCCVRGLGFKVKGAVSYVESLFLLDGERELKETGGGNVWELEEEEESGGGNVGELEEEEEYDDELFHLFD